MKKHLLIIIPIAIALAVVLTMALITNRQTPAWRARLDQYLTYMHTTGQASFRVLDYSPASQPGSFTPAMSTESFSDTPVFQTSNQAGAQFASSLEPVPYPPDEVVCVLLTNGNQSQLVYVTLHNSLYNADWIVHISSDPWNSPTLQSSLVNLGCTLSD